MPTIGSLTYTLVAKTDQFKQGLAGSGRALRDQKRLFMETRTDAEKYGLAMRRLEDLYKDGKISADVYSRSLSRLKEEIRQANQKSSGFIDGMKRALPTFSAVAAGMAAVNLASRAVNTALGLVNKAIDKTQEAFQRLDTVAKASDKLGLIESDLIGLRMAASEFSGFTESQFDTALQRMTRRIAEAAAGTGEAQGAIKSLGLDAKRLAESGPAEAFKQISEAMASVPNQGDRLRLAFKLFDSEGAGLVSTLAAGREEIERVIEESERLHGTELINFGSIEAANDAIGRFFAAIEGKFNVFASELAPLVKLIAEDLTGALTNTAPWEVQRSLIREFVIELARAVDNFDELMRRFERLQKGIEFMNRFNLNAVVGKKIGEFISGSKETSELESDPESRVARLQKAFAEADAALEKIKNKPAAKDSVGGGLFDFKKAEEDEKKIAATREAAEKKIATERRKAIMDAARLEESFVRRAEALRDTFKTPEEKMAEAKQEIQNLFMKGLIDDVTLGRAFTDFAARAEEMRGATAAVKPSTVRAVHAGSIEALRINQGNAKGPEERTAKATEESAKAEVEQLKVMRELLRVNTVLAGGAGGLLLSADSA